MSETGLPAFLFEIASDERLGILQALVGGPLRHRDLVRKLSLTGSEATRHLNRLMETGLITRNPEGGYLLTPLAEAVHAGLPFWEFLLRHRSYLASHRVDGLPLAFVERLGELSLGSFIEGTYPVVAVQEQELRRAERRIWVVTEHRFEQAIPILRERASRGVDVRVVRSRRLVEQERREGRDIERNFAFRTLREVKVFLAALDDQAGLCFPTQGGMIDLASMLLVTDPGGYRWARELFLTLWDQAEDPSVADPPTPPRHRRVA